MTAQTLTADTPAGASTTSNAPLRLFNTLTRSVEDFQPLEAGKAGLYSCGPTVYNHAHIGNLRSFIFADLLRRVLEAEGYAVKHVVNITDVGHLTSDADEGEDKMEKGARQQGRSVWEIAEFFTEAYKRDLERLQIEAPTVWCKATDHIEEMIELIAAIEEEKFTYRIEGDGIYFDTAKLPDYGRLARLDLAGQQAGARIGPNDEKRNPQDFALWKFSPTNERRQMEWDSPWGVGFPGWHIECSAMAAKYLGVPFDIHTGGVDHIPVHHTNEIAQTEAAEGKLLARWWMHGEFLVTRDAKMSKSSGDFLTLQSLTDEGYDPLVYRFFTYSAHYRRQLEFTREAMDGAKVALQNLHGIVAALPVAAGAEPDRDTLRRFRAALCEDLNAPQAVAVVWEAARHRELAPEVKRATLLAMNDVLPMGLETAHLAPRENEEAPAEVQALLEQRQAARKARDFATADAVRGQIADLGWEVRDTPEGVKLARR